MYDYREWLSWGILGRLLVGEYDRGMAWLYGDGDQAVLQKRLVFRPWNVRKTLPC